MSETQMRIYALETARQILGAMPLADILDGADEIYAFLVGQEPEPTRH